MLKPLSRYAFRSYSASLIKMSKNVWNFFALIFLSFNSCTNIQQDLSDSKFIGTYFSSIGTYFICYKTCLCSNNKRPQEINMFQ